MLAKNIYNIANPKELFLKDRLSLLKEIVKVSLINLPFQNLTSFGAFLPCERSPPQFKEILASGIKGEGGLCGHLSHFMKLYLESIGFDVEPISACFRRNGIPLSHQLLKVKIPGFASKEPVTYPMETRKDRTYLVDIACGVPLHEPICIETLPYQGRAGGLNFRFEKVNENIIQRVHECGDALMGKMPASHRSPQDAEIDLTPRKYTDDFIRESIHEIYTNPRAVYLHQSMYCFRYLNITDDDFEIVCMRGKELLFITKETRHLQSFSSYADAKPIILKYFPMISRRDVDLTVKHFSIPFEEAIKMSSNKNELQ